jgi:Fe-S-cluster-containing hydrogenase component 2
MDAITSPEGKAVVDRLRCIGCALCVTTCPSGALRLQANEKPRIPPCAFPHWPVFSELNRFAVLVCEVAP